MVSGFWYNQDGLPISYGTRKANPEVGGDYLVYGETREIEQLIPLVPMQLTTAGQLVPAPPTTFSGTSTPEAAGIQSLTTLVPLQLTAPVVTTTGGNLVLSASQIFIEEVTVENLITATGGTSVAVGLVATSPNASPPNSNFVQVTPNAGVQLISTLAIANQVVGQRISFTAPNTTGLRWDTATAVGTSGVWCGQNMPLVTNTITPLPASAWISTIATGTYTNGLMKLRMRYTVYANIPF